MSNNIQEIVGMIIEGKPIVQAVIECLKNYEEEFETFKNFYITNAVDVRTRLFKGFVEEGFTQEQALLLTMDSVQAQQSAIRNIQANKK